MPSKPYRICAIGGDGIGPEVLAVARRVLSALEIPIEWTEAEAGFGCFEKNGTPLPESTIEFARAADAILFGAVTTPPNIEGYRSAIVGLRKALDLFANVRPIHLLPIAGLALSPLLRPPSIDFVIVRENTEGLYVGDETVEADRAITRRVISRFGSERIVRFAYELARGQNRKKVAIVHKANVMRATDGLFLETALAVSRAFPEIHTETMLVDATAMRLIQSPEHFDVIVTTNMFGDILSDLGAGLVGGLGLVASANIGLEAALFEPVHGSAPDIAGQGIANPVAMLEATAMMVDHLGEGGAAGRIRAAVLATLNAGIRTQDLGGEATTGEFAGAVVSRVKTSQLVGKSESL